MMEENESPESGSPVGNMETESPPVSGGFVGSGGGGGEMVPPLMNTGGLGVAGGVDLMGKKKRGRPRKYDSDGNLRVPFVKSPPSESVTPPPGFISPHSSDFSSSNKSRGRPTGSGNWQLLSSFGELFAETAGGNFTPHVVNVYTGEDVAGKILSIIQRGPRGICILAANGAVSNVTIRQPGLSGGILTYEGRFEILSLTGSFTIAENGGVKSRNGGLSVCLAGPDGRVIGGGIAGLLTAASPIQIVVGSFVPNGYMKHKRKHEHQYEPFSPPPSIFSPPNVVPSTSPISQASPIINNAVKQNQTTPSTVQNDRGSDNYVNQHSSPLYTTGPDQTVHQRVYTDINVTALFE